MEPSGEGYAPKPKTPDRVTVKDLIPTVPEVGGTSIVLQVNARDKRDEGSLSDFGELLPEEAEATRTNSREFFNSLFDKLPYEERKSVDVLVVAANSRFVTLDRKHQTSHMRAYDTGEMVIKGLQEASSASGVGPDQLLNKTGRPMVLTSRRMEDLKAIEDSPKFVDILKAKYGDGVEFWAAFEDDVERETRVKMGVEGPLEIADRVRDYVGTVANAAKLWHEKHPDRRLIVWAVGHYDNLAPYIKENVTKAGTVGTFMKMDKKGGIVLTTGPDHKEATTSIQGQKFTVPLSKAA